MGKLEKLIIRILRGTSDSNIEFSALCFVLDKLGFSCRIKGSHHIYFKDGVDEIINIQEKKGMTKSYQVKQVRNIIIKYGLGGEKDE